MPKRASDGAGGRAQAFCDAAFREPPPPLDLPPLAGALPAADAMSAARAHALPAAEPDAARRNRALEGLALLWHGHGEAAHEIAQSREGDQDYDLLHALFHRREGDYGNAGYWFAQAGKHPCYPALARRLSTQPFPPQLREALLPGGAWSPAAFNAEARRRAREVTPAAELLIRIQAEEYRALAGWLLR